MQKIHKYDSDEDSMMVYEDFVFSSFKVSKSNITILKQKRRRLILYSQKNIKQLNETMLDRNNDGKMRAIKDDKGASDVKAQKKKT